MGEIPKSCEDRLFIRPVGFRSTKRAAVRYMESYGGKRWREDRRDSPRHFCVWSGDGARTRNGDWPKSRRRGDGPVASTIIFGSNLISDPCATCNYSDGGGYFVVGPDNCIQPGTTQWLAGTFIASATGVPEQISAPIILADPSHCPTNTVTLSIYTDACYPIGPGTPLVSAVATVPLAPCALAVAKLPNAAPVLPREQSTGWWRLRMHNRPAWTPIGMAPTIPSTHTIQEPVGNISPGARRP